MHTMFAFLEWYFLTVTNEQKKHQSSLCSSVRYIKSISVIILRRLASASLSEESYKTSVSSLTWSLFRAAVAGCDTDGSSLSRSSTLLPKTTSSLLRLFFDGCFSSPWRRCWIRERNISETGEKMSSSGLPLPIPVTALGRRQRTEFLSKEKSLHFRNDYRKMTTNVNMWVVFVTPVLLILSGVNKPTTKIITKIYHQSKLNRSLKFSTIMSRGLRRKKRNL